MTAPPLTTLALRGLPTWAPYLLWGVGVLATIALAAVGPWWGALVVPGIALAGLAVAYAVRRPLLNLSVVLGLFIMASRNDAGVGLVEVMFAAYYLPYLACWYASRLFIYREPLVQQRGDFAMIGLLLLAGLGGVYGAASGAEPSVLLGELGSFSLLAFYFPFREVCIRRDEGRVWLMGALVVLGIVAVGRNLFEFYALIASTVDLRGVAHGRIVINEVIIYFATAAALGGMLYLGRGAQRVLWYGGFFFCAMGVVLTQFRAFYLGMAVAGVVAFLLTDRRRRIRLLVMAAVSVGGMVAVAYALIGDLLVVFVVGVTERMLSIGTAGQEDISFINRFFEYERVWELIRERPLLGYGFGVEFGFYDAIYQATWTKAYVHNAYLHLLYKLGIIGLGVFAYVSALAGWRGLRAVRHKHDDTMRAGGVFVVAALLGLGVAGLATVLFNTDTMMPLAMCLAVGASLERRSIET